MSEAQPRKRRDKKKKKDEEEIAAPRAPRTPSLMSLENEDVNIHVAKEGGTGGGICAKLVFFVLLSALAVLIGLIITEQRGLTDLDTIEKESRFSQYFEGWVDNTPDDHDDNHGIDVDDHDEHVEPDDREEEEEEHDHDVEEEEAVSDEEALGFEVEEEEEVEEGEVEESIQEESLEEDEEEEDDDDDVEEGTEEVDEDEGTQEYEEEELGVEEESSQVYEEEGDKDEAKSEELEETKGDNDDQEEDDISDAPKTEEEQDEDDQEDELPTFQEQDIEAVALQKEVADDDKEDDTKSNEMADNVEETDEAEGEGEEQPMSVVKTAVGLVTLVVAYVVLIRKWKSDEAEEVGSQKEVSQDRRNTIVVPAKIEEVDLSYDDYSAGEEELNNEEEEEEEYEMKFDQQGKKEYQKLRNTYERSLTPDNDKFDENKSDEDYDGQLEPEESEEDELELEEEEGVEEIERADEEEEEYDPDEDEIVVEIRFDDEYDSEYDDDEEIEGPVAGEEEEDEEDEQLMKKLEEKYGKLSDAPQQPWEDDNKEGVDQHDYDEDFDPEEEEEGDDNDSPWKHGGTQQVATPDEEIAEATLFYINQNITNEDDFAIFDQLDEAQDNLNVNAALALSQFAAILKSHSRSPRGLYGRARALDLLAEQKQSNQLLTEAITNYHTLMTLENVPEMLFKIAGDRCINRLRFMGQYSKAIEIHRLMIKRFPNEISYRNQLAVTFLSTNRMEDARNEIQLSLERWPYDGFALVHYGFILKVHDGHLEPAVEFLQRGIATRDEGVIDGRFYFHLGDALGRLGRHDEATAVYQDGAEQKVFLSATQRSLYNVPTLKAQPWWLWNDTPLKYQQFFKQLERNFKAIRDEGLAVMKARGLFQDEAENLRDKGDWKQFELFARGIRNKKHCEKCPLTCKLVQTLPEAVGCRRGQVKFSVMLPGTHVWPHCGPTNCRLRAHLGLKVPEETFLRVEREIRSWKEGEIIIFDDSFEHEVWHNGTEIRLVLIVDVWHPELSSLERRTLSAI